MNELELTGRTRTHIEQLEEPRVALHREVVEPFLALRAAAAKEGIDLTPSARFAISRARPKSGIASSAASVRSTTATAMRATTPA